MYIQGLAKKPYGRKISVKIKGYGIIKELIECLLPPLEQSTFTGFSGVGKLGLLLYHVEKADSFYISTDLEPSGYPVGSCTCKCDMALHRTSFHLKQS
jgi:hypothetical protein